MLWRSGDCRSVHFYGWRPLIDCLERLLKKVLNSEALVGRQSITVQSYWLRIRHKLRHKRRACTLTASCFVLGVAGYAIVAHPWGDHQPQAQHIVLAAACAGAVELIRGAKRDDVMHAATSAAVSMGFRKTHGDQLAVTHSRPKEKRAFFVKATMSYRPAHFLLESFIENTSEKALEVVIVDQSNFEMCHDDTFSDALSQH